MRNTNNKNKRSKEIEKDIEIKKEVSKLNSLFKDMDKKYKKSVSSIIDNAAFMAVTLRELRSYLNENGLTCEYQNGENQFGIKKSPEVEIYNTMIKNFISTMKQLTDLLPKGLIVQDDGFEDFINNK